MDLRSLAIKISSEAVPPAPNSELCLITSGCAYYHYLCDGVDDKGWGCGYRSLQSLCSWAEGQRRSSSPPPVPSLRRIQETLVEVGDKPQSFVGSREWIGSFEVCIVLEQTYGVPSKIMHVATGSDVVRHVSELVKHFKNIGSPVMIGGNVDAASKTLIGIAADFSHCQEKTQFLIADPHYIGDTDEEAVIRDGFVKWHSLDLFSASSFYNFCLPQQASGHCDD